MTQEPRIPDAETRARNVARMREAGRQMDLVNLQLDELIAMIEADLRVQKRARLEKKLKQQNYPEKV
ncbi:hypothetical protein PCC7424_2513 [Gloeothece citriformis PCC 7424]|uniref:Uncharacterized protein n=1 Tax=Gloeothece citriformis (strain PCC 7424) TaxID=65393 RepID=B7KK45_GLOC7|nr:hypothetical protein [Gloeothece citriformis]ACK70930.1 hypothetical protein PCC7424_2513 [Gloeothece citriformis PCC 7424]